MALRGILREGAGGSGVAVLDLDQFPVEVVFVNTSMFGCGVTPGGQAIAACTSIPGTPHFSPAATQTSELRLVTLTANGRAGVSYGEIRLDPFWDPLRGDPRFEKIVASLAPQKR